MRIVKLPSGYRQVEYIQSSGTQYIDTGYAPSGENMRVVFDFMYTADHGSATLYGTQKGTSNLQFSITAYSRPMFYVGTSQALLVQSTSLNTRYVLDAHANSGTLSVSLNGATQTAVYSGSLEKTLSLSLFGNNINGATSQFVSAKAYSCQIYDNGTLVRDFVPCITSAGEVGLYDDVNGVFYGNAGTGTFAAGQRVYAEDEITKLEYIESTGTQYVDTEFMPNQNTGVTMDFEVTDTSATSWLFCGRTAANNSAFGVYAYSGGTRFYFAYGTEQSNFTGTTTLRQICTANKNQCTIGENTVTITAQTFTSTATLCLLARNTGGTIAGYALAKLYSCQVYDNGVMVRDYYPATVDGIVGLWDALSGVLYENAGSGTFIAGPIIYEGLPAPGNLTAEVTETGVILRWESVETALGYRVYRDYLFLTETADTKYTDSDTQNWEQYTYSVRAFNEEEEGAAASVAVILTSNNPILDLITDRSDADVNRVVELSQKDFLFEMTDEERKEFLGSMKGAYNASDLNRVGAALMYIANRLNAQGTAVKISPKTDWTKSEVPTQLQVLEYLADVSTIRGAVAVMKRTPKVPADMENFTYIEANNIEQILLDVDFLITNISLAWFYCGEVYSGEV